MQNVCWILLLEISPCLLRRVLLWILGLAGENVCVCVLGVGMGGGSGAQESPLICIRAAESLRTVLLDFVYKHWAGCLEGKEVKALSEP